MFEIQNLHYDPETNTLTIHLNPELTEFSMELNGSDMDPNKRENLKDFVKRTIQSRMKGAKVKTAKVMLGTIILTTLSLQPSDVEAATEFNMGYLYFGSPSSQATFVERTHGVINQTSPSYFDINPDGTLNTSKLNTTFINEMKSQGIKVVPFLSNHWDRNLGRAALENREQLAQQIADTIKKYDLDGVNVDIENVSDIDRDNYTDLVRLLREKIPADKEVSVAVAANPNGWTKGWHGSYDYNQLAKYSDYLMIMAYDESWAGSAPGPVASISFVENSIKYALNQGVPANKIVIGLPHYGRYWVEGAASGGNAMTNDRVEQVIAKYNGTVTFDPVSKSPKATVVIKESDPKTTISGATLTPGTYTIWYENEQSIKAKVDLVDKYGLKGTGSWALGQENAALWGEFATWIPNKAQLVSSTEIQTDGKVALTSTNVNIRTAPSTTTGEVISTAASGNIVQFNGDLVPGENYNWYPVKLSNGTTGYIAANYIKIVNSNEIHGPSRYDTSVAISQDAWEVSDYVVLGRGDNPIDALTGSVLAKKYNAPLLLTQTNAVPEQVQKEIERLGATNVILLGGTSAISSSVEQALISKGLNVERISGSNRYDTSVQIASEIGPTDEIIITTGNNSPDPLSIAPYAGMKQIPIVLSGKDKVTSEVVSMISDQNISKVTIIGGEAVISEDVVQQLKDLGVTDVNRISGKNRYETSVAIAKTYGNEFDLSNVYFTSGESYVDALSGSPLAAMNGSPIILLNKDKITQDVSTWVSNNLSSNNTKVNFLGGYSVLSKNNRVNLFQLLK